MVHVYTADGVQMAIKAGVKSFEHGQMIDEATAKLMANPGNSLVLIMKDGSMKKRKIRFSSLEVVYIQRNGGNYENDVSTFSHCCVRGSDADDAVCIV